VLATAAHDGALEDVSWWLQSPGVGERAERPGLRCSEQQLATSARWTPPQCGESRRRAMGFEGGVFMLGGLFYEALSGGGVLPPAAQRGALCVREARQYAASRLLADRTDDPLGAPAAPP
jgi:hypothetical protein